MVSFTGQINYYTKELSPYYSPLTMQNRYEYSNYYDTMMKIPQPLQDSFYNGLEQAQVIADQLPENEDIHVRVVEDRFHRPIALELHLPKPNIEQATFKSGPIYDLQNIFENFIYEVQNKLFIQQEQQRETQANNPYAYLNPSQQQQGNNQYSNPFSAVQGVDEFKEELLMDNMTPNAISEEDAGNAQNVPFSYAPSDEGYGGMNEPDSYGQNDAYQADYNNPQVYTDSSMDFNQGGYSGQILG